MLTDEVHVRLPRKVIKMINKAVRDDQEHLNMSDFIRGACVRRLKDLGMWEVKR